MSTFPARDALRTMEGAPSWLSTQTRPLRSYVSSLEANGLVAGAAFGSHELLRRPDVDTLLFPFDLSLLAVGGPPAGDPPVVPGEAESRRGSRGAHRLGWQKKIRITRSSGAPSSLRAASGVVVPKAALDEILGRYVSKAPAMAGASSQADRRDRVVEARTGELQGAPAPDALSEVFVEALERATAAKLARWTGAPDLDSSTQDGFAEPGPRENDRGNGVLHEGDRDGGRHGPSREGRTERILGRYERNAPATAGASMQADRRDGAVEARVGELRGAPAPDALSEVFVEALERATAAKLARWTGAPDLDSSTQDGFAEPAPRQDDRGNGVLHERDRDGGRHGPSREGRTERHGRRGAASAPDPATLPGVPGDIEVQALLRRAVRSARRAGPAARRAPEPEARSGAAARLARAVAGWAGPAEGAPHRQPPSAETPGETSETLQRIVGDVAEIRRRLEGIEEGASGVPVEWLSEEDDLAERLHRILTRQALRSGIDLS